MALIPFADSVEIFACVTIRRYISIYSNRVLQRLKKAKQMKIRCNFVAISVLISTALTGCGDSEIDAVKATYVDQGETMTFGQLLDNRPICESVKWDTSKDGNQRTMVEYTCVFKGADDFLSIDRENTIKRQLASFDLQIQQAKEANDRSKKIIEDGYESSEQAVMAVQKEIEEIENLLQSGSLDPKIARLSGLKDKLSYSQQILNVNKNRVESSKRDVADFPGKLKELEARRDEASVTQAAMKSWPIFNNIRERLQWIVNKEGRVSLVSVGFYADKKSGNEVRLYSGGDPNSLNRYLTALYNSKASDWRMYVFNRQMLGSYMMTDFSWRQ